MNILIVGGLLILAVVAAVGVILLGMDEERIQKQRKMEGAAPPMQTTEAEAIQAAEVEIPTAIPTPEMPSSVPSRSLHPTRLEGIPTPTLPSSTEEESTAILSYEIHAMASDLRLLAQKASEMEQRLGQLSNILERQQHPQNGLTARSPLTRVEGRE